VDEGEALALAAAWESAEEQRRRLAWKAVRRAARSANRGRALKAAQSNITTWSNRWSPLVAYGNPGALVGGDVRAEVMRRAVPALVDAVSALVVGGLIDAADFEALYGPFRSVDEGAS